jgi:hypothetical protein
MPAVPFERGLKASVKISAEQVRSANLVEHVGNVCSSVGLRVALALVLV